MNFQVFTTGESLPATGKLTDKWLFTSVNANMIDQLVLSLECRALTRATVPVASVICVFFEIKFRIQSSPV